METTPRSRTRSNAKLYFLLSGLLHLLLYVEVYGQSPAPRNAPTAAPTIGGGGQWRLLRKSIGISAMHMQVLPDDTVVMFDRTDSGPSNISLPVHHGYRRCRLRPSDEISLSPDCTAHSVVFHLSSSVIRPLTLLSDTWCSSGALLPNGSLLQTGGFSDGDRTVRLLPSTSHRQHRRHNRTDWVEIPDYLVARRWYASNQILPDGRVIILGGRRQFSYEFFPRDPDAAAVQFPFLVQTYDQEAENNLYPFLHLLPDGSLFVFANDRAVLLDAMHHRVLRRLPRVRDGPRSYPSSGASVLLPLRPGAPAEVLVCGGARHGAYQAALNGTFLPALRTCLRITPAEPDPSWTMEHMPVARVMGDMVLLPTCEVIIVNGAAAGTAGWELARRPVLHPVLYQPDQPIGARFTVLSRTRIPRMYHSTAALDPYGRVLVGGSNPQAVYTFTNVTYPTELSLEAFYPPYLSALLRPRILAAPSEVGYRERVAVRFEVEGREPGPWEEVAVEVVALAPAFATHAVGMNQRAVLLEVARTARVFWHLGYEVEVVTPATPEVAPPGYYLWFVVHEGMPSEGVWVRIW